MIFLATRKFFPDVGVLPEFTTPRKRFSQTHAENGGVTPFPLHTATQWMEKRFGPGPAERAAAAAAEGGLNSSRFSVSSFGSDVEALKTPPLRKPEKILAKWLGRVQGRGQ